MRARLTPTVCCERLRGRLTYLDALHALRGRLAALCAPGLGTGRDLIRVEATVDPATAPAADGWPQWIAWLATAPGGHRLAFRSRDGSMQCAGAGWALSTHDWRHPALTGIVSGGSEEPSDVSSPVEPLDPAVMVLEPFHSGSASGEEWRDFESTRLLLPAVEWRQGTGDPVLAVQAVGTPTPALEMIDALAAAGWPGDTHRLSCEAPLWRLCDDGDPARWADSIDAALAAIGAGRLEKVVMARTRRYACDRRIDPVDVMALLHAEEPDAYLLMAECGAGRAFVAASPERLFERHGRTVRSEAVAGTCARGPDAPSDERLAQRLLASDKNRREHDIVTRCIESALRPLTTEVSAAASPRVVRCAHVQHLATPISGALREGVDDGTVLGRLHPTPAVCGLPLREARAFIVAHESSPRGMYAGAIGLVSPRASEFAVGIRSALIDGDRLTAYAGAGIVTGSEPDAEWLETARKLESFDALLRPARVGDLDAAMGAARAPDVAGIRRPVPAASRAV